MIQFMRLSWTGWLLVLCLAGGTLQAQPLAQSLVQTLRVGVISESANNWPMWVAEANGYFREEGLDVKVVVTGESIKQLDALASGELEITHQAADHFVKSVEQGRNFFVFMTISRPIFDFIVTPGIRNYSDLRGKTIALDQLTTGYWLLYRKVLAQNGLKPGDYVIQGDSGGPEFRLKAVIEGRAQATYMNPPASLEAVADGLTRLTGLAEHFPDFPGSSGGARRDWAKQNEATLVKYLRAYIRAVDWLLDASNRDEAIAIAARRVKIDPKSWPGSYDAFVKTGLIPKAAISRSGFQQVLELMAESDLLKPPLAPMEKYADTSHQEKAAASLMAK